MGGEQVVVFPEGGYGSIRTPLLSGNESLPICFGNNSDTDWSDICIKSKPSIADHIPYSYIAIQARPNSFPHSEVDFGTFIWSAFGSRLLSEYGMYCIFSVETQK